MSDLGEALALLYTAPYLPFETLRLTMVDWSNDAVNWRATYGSATEVAPGILAWERDGMSGTIHGRPEPEPEDVGGRVGGALSRLGRGAVRMRVEHDGSIGVRGSCGCASLLPARRERLRSDHPASGQCGQ